MQQRGLQMARKLKLAKMTFSEVKYYLFSIDYLNPLETNTGGFIAVGEKYTNPWIAGVCKDYINFCLR